MFQNYIKLAFKVMGRNRFYTFISLFGISFTLMILMVLTAFLDDMTGNHSPLLKGDRITFVARSEMWNMVPDTTLIIDSTETGGMMVYDTTYNIGETHNSVSMSNPSFHLLNDYLRDMPYVEDMTVFSSNHSFDIFINSNKLSFNGVYTDAPYWDIFDFRFIEGGAYREGDVANRLPKAVLSQEARSSYFGSGVEALGKEVLVNQTRFEVVGVVEDVSPPKRGLHADIYMPYTFMRTSDLKNPALLGGFTGAFLLSQSSDMARFDEELKRKSELIPIPEPEARDYNTLKIKAYNQTERLAHGMFYEEDKADSMRIFMMVFGGLMALFILLPTLNLINVNVTRIMERSSEIGLRKAFGASTRDLMIQFLFENVILTLIGGIIGCLLAIGLIWIINDSKILTDMTLRFHPGVFVYGFFLCLFFGLLSGLLPALRMSRLHVVNALKENAL